MLYSEIILNCLFFTSNSGCWWCCSERGIFLVLVHSSFLEAAIRKAIVSYSHLIGNCTAGKVFYIKFCKHSTWILFQFAMTKNGMGIDQIWKTLKSDSKLLVAVNHMTKKLTSQKSPIWQKLNLSPVGCCGDWSGPPTYSLTIIIVLIIFALVTTSQLTPLHEKRSTQTITTVGCLAGDVIGSVNTYNFTIHYSCVHWIHSHPHFYEKNSLHIRSPESGSTWLFLYGMKGG